MYTPAAFRVNDTESLHALVRANPFATLVTVRENQPFATHVPFRLEVEEGKTAVLRTHLARANPQWEHWSETGSSLPNEEVLVIFTGPHAYISPTWYAPQPNVPTWNYAAVHVYGTPRLMTAAELETFLADLIRDYEGDGTDAWSYDSLSAEYREKMLRGIVGVEITVTRWEGKWKMSQNRNEVDRRGVIAGLLALNDPLARATADEMERRSS